MLFFFVNVVVVVVLLVYIDFFSVCCCGAVEFLSLMHGALKFCFFSKPFFFIKFPSIVYMCVSVFLYIHTILYEYYICVYVCVWYALRYVSTYYALFYFYFVSFLFHLFYSTTKGEKTVISYLCCHSCCVIFFSEKRDTLTQNLFAFSNDTWLVFPLQQLPNYEAQVAFETFFYIVFVHMHITYNEIH